MSTEAQIRASAKYNKSRDYFGIRPDKETGARIREAAAKAGQSAQKYILQAVGERIESRPRFIVAEWKKLAIPGLFECSNCKLASREDSAFCPNCGAKMENAR